MSRKTTKAGVSPSVLAVFTHDYFAPMPRAH